MGFVASLNFSLEESHEMVMVMVEQQQKGIIIAPLVNLMVPYGLYSIGMTSLGFSVVCNNNNTTYTGRTTTCPLSLSVCLTRRE